MVRYSRRTLLKGSAALAGALAATKRAISVVKVERRTHPEHSIPVPGSRNHSRGARYLLQSPLRSEALLRPQIAVEDGV